VVRREIEVVRLEIGRVGQLHVDEAVGVAELETAEEHAVYDGVLGGDGADADGEHEDGEGAEGLFLDEHTQADAEVLEERFDDHGEVGMRGGESEGEGESG
jgi:hypothetical protein